MSLEWRGIDRMRSHPLFGIAGRASLRTRRRAYEWLRSRVGGFRGKIVLDHGATPDVGSIDSNCHIAWLIEDGATVLATSAEDIAHLPTVFPGLRVVEWPPSQHFERPVDLVVSSSVIAHVGDRSAQRDYAIQLLRLSDRVFLTTPNRDHWLEFHTKLPLLHWLPKARYRRVLRAIGLGFWTHLDLLDRADLEALFVQAARSEGARIDLAWYEPRLMGRVSNLVVFATRHDEPSGSQGA